MAFVNVLKGRVAHRKRRFKLKLGPLLLRLFAYAVAPIGSWQVMHAFEPEASIGFAYLGAAPMYAIILYELFRGIRALIKKLSTPAVATQFPTNAPDGLKAEMDDLQAKLNLPRVKIHIFELNKDRSDAPLWVAPAVMWDGKKIRAIRSRWEGADPGLRRFGLALAMVSFKRATFRDINRYTVFKLLAILVFAAIASIRLNEIFITYMLAYTTYRVFVFRPHNSHAQVAVEAAQLASPEAGMAYLETYGTRLVGRAQMRALSKKFGLAMPDLDPDWHAVPPSYLPKKTPPAFSWRQAIANGAGYLAGWMSGLIIWESITGQARHDWPYLLLVCTLGPIAHIGTNWIIWRRRRSL